MAPAAPPARSMQVREDRLSVCLVSSARQALNPILHPNPNRGLGSLPHLRKPLRRLLVELLLHVPRCNRRPYPQESLQHRPRSPGVIFFDSVAIVLLDGPLLLPRKRVVWQARCKTSISTLERTTCKVGARGSGHKTRPAAV